MARVCAGRENPYTMPAVDPRKKLRVGNVLLDGAGKMRNAGPVGAVDVRVLDCTGGELVEARGCQARKVNVFDPEVADSQTRLSGL